MTEINPSTKDELLLRAITDKSNIDSFKPRTRKQMILTSMVRGTSDAVLKAKVDTMVPRTKEEVLLKEVQAVGTGGVSLGLKEQAVSYDGLLYGTDTSGLSVLSLEAKKVAALTDIVVKVTNGLPSDDPSYQFTDYNVTTPVNMGSGTGCVNRLYKDGTAYKMEQQGSVNTTDSMVVEKSLYELPGVYNCNRQLYNDKIYIGGSPTIRVFDIKTKSYIASEQIQPPYTLSNSGFFIAEGYMYIIGGSTSGSPGYSKALFKYNLTDHTYVRLADAPVDMSRAGGTKIGNYIYIGTDTPSFLRYNILTNTWSTLATPANSLYNCTFVPGPDGDTVYSMACNCSASATSYIRKYIISTNTWSGSWRIGSANFKGFGMVVGNWIHYYSYTQTGIFMQNWLTQQIIKLANTSLNLDENFGILIKDNRVYIAGGNYTSGAWGACYTLPGLTPITPRILAATFPEKLVSYSPLTKVYINDAVCKITVDKQV